MPFVPRGSRATLDATWRRELRLLHRLGSGTIMSGYADLVLEHEGRAVIVDHKSFPGAVEQAIDKAAGFAGQLGAYAAAVSAATGKEVAGMYVHLPVSGVVVRVE